MANVGQKLCAAFMRRSVFFILLGLLWLTVLLERLTDVLVHEYVAVIVALLTIHHLWVNRWSFAHLWPEHISPYMLYRNFIALGLMLAFIVTMVSGIAISQHVFAFLNLSAGPDMRTLHNAGAAYFLIFVGLHGGVHVSKLYALLKDNLGSTVAILCAICLLPAALYGLSKLCTWEMLDKLTLQASFSFFDYDAPKIFGLIDGAAQVVACMFIGAILTRLLLNLSAKR